MLIIIYIVPDDYLRVSAKKKKNIFLTVTIPWNPPKIMCAVVTIILNYTTNGHGRGGVVDFHTEIEFYDIFYDIFKYNYTDYELPPVTGKDFESPPLPLPSGLGGCLK